MNDYIQMFGSLILGWLAWEIRQLRRDVSKRVHYEECNRKMDIHYDRIDRIDEAMRDQNERLARLETK